jgi:hypothetical protein
MDDASGLLGVLFFLATLGLLPAFIAHHKGRSFRAFWLLGTLAFPVAMIIALVVRRGDTEPLWGRWGMVSSPQRAIRLVPIFLAINLVHTVAPTSAVGWAAIVGGCALLAAVVNHFVREPTQGA